MASATWSSLDRGYPGGGATGRNVARLRAMQLTEELTHVARACQAKYDRMGEELGFNVLFYRLGYAWVLYEADEVERMRAIVEMHHRIGVASRLLSPDDTLRRLPILTGGEPVAGAVVNDDDAIVHHDAVVWAHLEHLARTSVRVVPNTTVQAIVRDDRGVVGGRHRPRADRDAGRAQRDRRLVDRAQRAGRRLGPEPAAPARGAGDRAAPPLDRGGGHLLPPDRGLVQPDAPGRDRDGRRRPGRTGRREPGVRPGRSCVGPRRS